MNELETKNSGGVDYTMADKFAALGIRSGKDLIEKPKQDQEVILNETELGRGISKSDLAILNETIDNIDQKIAIRERNHEGAGRKAGPELAEALASITPEANKTRENLAKLAQEEASVAAEVEQIKRTIREAKKAGQQANVNNWEIRLRNKEIILAKIKEVTPFVPSKFGRAIVYNLHEFIEARDKQAQAELKVLANAESPEAKAELRDAQVEVTSIKRRIGGLIDERGPAEQPKKVVEVPPAAAPTEAPKNTQATTEKLVKTDHSIYDLNKEKEAMQSEMDALLKNTVAPEEKRAEGEIKVETTTMKEELPTQTHEVQPRLNEEALALLETVAAGNLPTDSGVTNNLRKIAEQNGLNVTNDDTFASIVERLRAINNMDLDVFKNAEAATQTTAEKNWQEQAIQTFENEGGKVLDAELKPTESSSAESVTPVEAPEVPTPASPEVAGAIETPVEAPVTREASAIVKALAPEEKIWGTPLSGQEGAFNKLESLAKAETPEQKLERILKAIHNPERESAIAARAEKAGLLMDWVKERGERWNKVPTRNKWIISGTLILAGAGLGASAAPVVAGIGGTMRLFGMAGLFTAADESMRKSVESKSGTPRTAEEKSKQQALAAGLAVVVGLFLPKVLHDSVLNPLVDFAHSLHDPINGGAILASQVPHVAAPTHFEAPPVHPAAAEKLAELSTVHKGEGFWQPVHNQLAAQHPELSADELNQKTQELLVKNGIIGADGSELRVSEVGSHVILNADGTISYNQEATYTGPKTLTVEETMNYANPEIKGFDVPVAPEIIPAATTAPHGLLEGVTIPGEATIHPNAHIAVGNIEGTFQYAAGDKVSKITLVGQLNSNQMQEAHNLLKDTWRGTALSNNTGLSDLNTVVVEDNAELIYRYEQILHSIEAQKGGKFSSEANFLHDEINRILTSTEKTYGHVFKNINEVYPGTQPLETAAHSNVVESAVAKNSAGVMPQQINPSSPELLTYTNQYVHNAANDLFGRKPMIFGLIGGVDGSRTPDWNDFSHRTVGEVLDAKPNAAPLRTDVGIHNNAALHKMQEGIRIASSKTGIQPIPNETIEGFLGRAAASTYGKK